MADSPPTQQQSAATSAVRTGLTLSTAALSGVLGALYGAAYAAGAHSASEAITGGSGGKVPGWLEQIDAGIDWDKWTPGDGEAAQVVAEGGLRDLLNARGVTIQALVQDRYNELGNLLARGIANGDSTATIASAMVDLLDVPSRAAAISRTEVAAAMTASAMEVYHDAGIQQVNLLTADPCPACEAIAAKNPWDIDAIPQPPEHPNCRCALSPVHSTAPSMPTPEDAGTVEQSASPDQPLLAFICVRCRSTGRVMLMQVVGG